MSLRRLVFVAVGEADHRPGRRREGRSFATGPEWSVDSAGSNPADAAVRDDPATPVLPRSALTHAAFSALLVDGVCDQDRSTCLYAPPLSAFAAPPIGRPTGLAGGEEKSDASRAGGSRVWMQAFHAGSVLRAPATRTLNTSPQCLPQAVRAPWVADPVRSRHGHAAPRGSEMQPGAIAESSRPREGGNRTPPKARWMFHVKRATRSSLRSQCTSGTRSAPCQASERASFQCFT